MTNDPQKANANDAGIGLPDQIAPLLGYWDKHQVCRFANDAYPDWFGKDKTEIVDKMTAKELLGLRYEKNLQHILAALNGEVQVFEREIVLPNGSIRNAITTYTPDIVDGEVQGFFVHLADITYIKKLEQQQAVARKELLGSIIETQEKERKYVASSLLNSVTQTLAYCKMVLQIKNEPAEDNSINQQVTDHIQNAIAELNALSANLHHTGTEFLGFTEGTKNYIDIFSKKQDVPVEFLCSGEDMEKLDINDKLSLFRIVQDYLQILATYKAKEKIDIRIHYQAPQLQMELKYYDAGFTFKKNSNKYKDIALRVEYYSGTLQEVLLDTENILLINCTVG